LQVLTQREPVRLGQVQLALEQKSRRLQVPKQGRHVEADSLAQAPTVGQREPVRVLMAQRVPEHVRVQQPEAPVVRQELVALLVPRERALPNCHNPRPLLQSPERELSPPDFVSLPSF